MNITEISEHTKKAVTKKYGNSFVFLHHTGGMYGIGCAYDDRLAIRRIIQLKNKPSDTSFILLVPDFRDQEGFSIGALQEFLKIDIEIDVGCAMLLDQYWPGNLSVCFGVSTNTDEQLRNYKRFLVDGKLAMRCPTDRLLRDLIRAIGKPVISTSINKTGEKPLDKIEQIGKLEWFDFSVIEESVSDEAIKEPKQSTIVSANKRSFECLREGQIPCKQVQESYNNPLITFICTGNICRSPMAEFYARDQMEHKGLPFKTASAGVFASGYSISTNSEIALKEDNIDSTDHLSQQVDHSLISRSYLVLAMEDVHKNVINNMFPEMKHKVYTIAEFCGDDLDVTDPFTKDRSVYDDTYNLIKRYVDIMVEKLERKFRAKV